jgi:hypothetical protein
MGRFKQIWQIYQFGLNLFSPQAFLFMNMPEVADIEHLPVTEARAGEPAAWDTLFRRYQLPLYVYVFELVRDEQAGLDIVQETFIAAVQHIGNLREDNKFGSWLFGIACQKCVQRWRKQRELPSDEMPESPMNLKTVRMTCSSGANRRPNS